MQEWDYYIGGSQQLSDWNKGSVNRREVIPSTENLAKKPMARAHKP